MGSGSSKSSSAVSSSNRSQTNKQQHPVTNNSNDQPTRQSTSVPKSVGSTDVNSKSNSTHEQANGVHTSSPKKEIGNGKPSYIKEKTVPFDVARKNITSAVSRKALVQKRFNRGFSRAKIQARKEKCTDNPVLLGDISQRFPPTAKIVRIFTSSTFTDTKHERNAWMVNSYPRIQSFCRDHGYDFQVVDMRWGIRDEASDDHSVLELCLRELLQCQKLSTGPNFVSLLSHRYGYRNLLKQIEAEEFEQLIQGVESTEDRVLLHKWYKRDDNAVPPVYVLQRISTYLPDFVSPNKQDRNKAKDLWWTEHDQMQDSLATAAEKYLGPEKARNYLVSVTEREVQKGILDIKDPGKCCVWLKRNLIGIENETPTYQLSRFIDCSGEEAKWRKSRQLLSELKEERMPKVLPTNNVMSYDVKWIPGGIDPKVKDHSTYLNQISEDLVNKLHDMIGVAITEREKQESVEPVLEECKQHIVFCQDKSSGFQGRDDILQKIKTYVTGSSQTPLVVHGSSGCGKTSIMAMAAKLTKTSWKKQSAVICRFLGTTPDSSTIGHLLKNLILQIKKIYGQDTVVSEDLEDLKEEFVTALGLPLGDLPLIIYLDSLDQLDPVNGARGLSWLPTEFSKSVKIVVSTLTDRQYEAFPKLKAVLPDENSFIDVPVLSVKDVKSIINSWLKSQHRTLTPKQNEIVVGAFNKCSLALFLKLSLDEACLWSSFTPPDQTVLETTVRKSINRLFQQLEVRYGNLFVGRVLGYLTVALNGLSESELEDILACDDDVLNDVYQYWTPPTRRLPPLLLIRLKTDLDQYLVDRGADGMRVIYWYHRQFIEAATDRYCTKQNQKILHSALADFFSGTWANGNKKPFVNSKTKAEGSEDRLVTAQPLKFKDKYNYRKLGHLAYHRIKAGQVELVKSECICNYQFLQTKLIAMSYRRVFMDLKLARITFENDKELGLIADAFRLSEYALSHDPYQLAPHMIGRLSKEKIGNEFIEQCRQSEFPYLASSDEVLIKPGGELIYTMTGHTTSVKSLDVMEDGSMAVTCGQFGDDVIRTWSLTKGKLLKEYDNLPKDPEKVYFVDKDRRILIHYRTEVVVINITDNTQFRADITASCQLCVCGPDRSIYGTFFIRECNFFSIVDGQLKQKLTCDGDKNLFDIRSIITATSDYVALTHAVENEFYVINIKAKQMSIGTRETSSYSVDGIVITPSQKTVICASFLESSIRMYDIKTLNIIKTIQTRDNAYEEISNFHLTRDGSCLYFPCYRDVIMIDLKAETETKKLRSHPDSVTDVQIFSGDKALTITQDSIVRIWDMEETECTSEIDCPLKDHHIVEFRPLPNCRHVVILGNPKSTERDDYYMYTYDLVDKCIVQSTELDEGSHLLEVIDDNTVLVLPMSLKPKTIDLQTMSIKTVFQGKVSERCKFYQMAKEGKEFMCLSRGRKNIKVYNTSTGKVINILKSPAQKDFRIDSFFANKNGSTVVAKADETFIIFAVDNGGKTTTVSAADLKMEIIGDVAAVCPNGNHVVLSACKVEATEVWENEPIGFLWNVKEGQKKYQLVDSEFLLKYKRSYGTETVAFDEVKFLDDEKIVSSHDDFIIRVWNALTGELLHRLTGHTRQAMLTVPDSGPYFLSYGFMDEEVIKLWDRNTFQCISSFKFDTTVGKLRFCGDNETFVTSTENPVNLVHWYLHGKEPAKTLPKYPKLQRKNYNLQLEIETDKDAEEEADDPDNDPEEPEDSEDECCDLEMF